MFAFSTQPTSQHEYEEYDDHPGGGFYPVGVESADDFNLSFGDGIEATQTGVTDIKELTLNHILNPPDEPNQNLVQDAQEQFNSGNKLKFIDSVKAREHYKNASIYFRRAADQIKFTTMKQSLYYLADNSELMAAMLDKVLPKDSTSTELTNASPNWSSSKSKAPHLDKKAISTDSDHLESILNAPHLYDKVYEVLPMSTSMSFFGGFQTSCLSDDNSRARLVQSRDLSSGLSLVPSADMSSSSSFYASQNTTGQLSLPLRQFLQDLKLLERRLGAIGLMPLSETVAAASLREKESEFSKSALSTSTARLNFLSTRLDESYIVLPPTVPPTNNAEAISTNPYGSTVISGNKISSDKQKNRTEEGSSRTPLNESAESDESSSYWGSGILQIASKITGMTSSSNECDDKSKSNASNLTSNSQNNKGNIVASEHLNGNDTVFPSMGNTDVDDAFNKGRVRFDSWESVSDVGNIEDNAVSNAAGCSKGIQSDSKQILSLLNTIKRLSEENSNLEKRVESLKNTQHKNSLLISQVDQFKVEYKLKMDRMKEEIVAFSKSNKNPVEKTEDNMTLAEKDKRLNELERTVNALLRKMAQIKQESDRKDKLIDHYKSKRVKKDREKEREKRVQGIDSNIVTISELGKGGNPRLRHPETTTTTGGSTISHQIPTSDNTNRPSLSSRRGIGSRTVSTSSAAATTALYTSSDCNIQNQGSNRPNGQSRSRISLASASPSTATLRNSLQREISGGF